MKRPSTPGVSHPEGDLLWRLVNETLERHPPLQEMAKRLQAIPEPERTRYALAAAFEYGERFGRVKETETFSSLIGGIVRDLAAVDAETVPESKKL